MVKGESMGTVRKLERMFFRCPEVNGADYLTFPLLSDDDFFIMKSEFYADCSYIYFFPFIRRNKSEELFVELYIWDYAQYPDVYKRFIIFDGYRMNEEDEEEFLSYAKRTLHASPKIIEQFSKDLQIMFPQWHTELCLAYDYFENRVFQRYSRFF